MNILVTATKMGSEEKRLTIKILSSLKDKYGDKVNIATGFTAPHIKIAQIAKELGFYTVLFIPEMKDVREDHVRFAKEVKIAAMNRYEYYGKVLEYVGAVIALQYGDPFLLHAKRMKIRTKVYEDLDSLV